MLHIGRTPGRCEAADRELVSKRLAGELRGDLESRIKQVEEGLRKKAEFLKKQIVRITLF